MKKLVGYLVGLFILIGVFAMVFIAATIYNTTNQITVEAYFMRDDVTSGAPPNLPIKMADISNKRMRDWLIQKFVMEYFYVVPDDANITARTQAGGYSAPLYYLGNKKVFQNWVATEAEHIKELAHKGVMRTVTVFDEIFKLPDSNYWRVDYEFKTWYNPNDMSDSPVIERGTMYLDITGDSPVKLGNDIETISRALNKGLDPSGIFSFEVYNVEFDKE